jgi:Iron-sulfur cluster binding domain of dihydroorotate dehydrogenase B
MGHSNGRIIEIRLDAGGLMEALIACPDEAIPQAGQYLHASDMNDPQEVLGVSLFLAEKSIHGFWAASPIPVSWRPGTYLDLVGPLGHGFELPRVVQRLGLVALGDSVARLMPLIGQIEKSHSGITLFTDLPLPRMPALLEAYPLASLKQVLDWPDFLAFDLPLQRLPELRDVLGLRDGSGLYTPSQVLVTPPMPCAGLANCGACAVPARRGWKLACEDGPVFDLSQLKW